MADFAKIYKSEIDGLLKKCIQIPEQKESVVQIIMTEFVKVRKKPVMNLNARLAKIESRVRIMLDTACLEFVNGRLIVKAVGPAEQVLNEFRFGTDWYYPWEKVDEIVLAAILSKVNS